MNSDELVPGDKVISLCSMLVSSSVIGAIVTNTLWNSIYWQGFQFLCFSLLCSLLISYVSGKFSSWLLGLARGGKVTVVKVGPKSSGISKKISLIGACIGCIGVGLLSVLAYQASIKIILPVVILISFVVGLMVAYLGNDGHRA